MENISASNSINCFDKKEISGAPIGRLIIKLMTRERYYHPHMFSELANSFCFL